MYLLGETNLAEAAQRIVQADFRFAGVLAASTDDGGLILYRLATGSEGSGGTGRFVPWARLTPTKGSTKKARLYALSSWGEGATWQAVDVTGDLIRCLEAIQNNQYDRFFR